MKEGSGNGGVGARDVISQHVRVLHNPLRQQSNQQEPVDHIKAMRAFAMVRLVASAGPALPHLLF